MTSLEQEASSSKLVAAGQQALNGSKTGSQRPGQKVIVIKDLLRTAGAFLIMPSASSQKKASDVHFLDDS